MTDAPPLPGVLAEIADVAGREAALAVALEHGGLEIHIPSPTYMRSPAGAECGLVRLLGRDAAECVAARLGGTTLYIPQARHALASHLAAQGLEPREIAARLRISQRTLRRYANDR